MFGFFDDEPLANFIYYVGYMEECEEDEEETETDDFDVDWDL